MPRTCYLISHPNVVVSRDVAVERWPLSALGRERMTRGLGQPWVAEIGAIYCSSEQKAIDGAQILAAHRSLGFTAVPELGENDRSATGFLPPDEFEAVADQFFAHPEQSVRGWETAVAAQARMVRAVGALAASDTAGGALAIVAHGAVGTLLYCHLARQAIARRWDQPANGGGNYFAFELDPPRALCWWRPIDACAR